MIQIGANNRLGLGSYYGIDINNAGQILVGVPLPPTIAFMATGLLGLVMVRLRERTDT